jgi:hypothetical protein
LGEKSAFRCRELLFFAEMYAINKALEPGSGVDPRSALPELGEFCYLCHIYLTTAACYDLQNQKQERDREDMASPGTTQQQQQQQQFEVLQIANRIMVSIDVNGEYRHEVMLAANDVSSLGIWGPFPEWNPRNYIPCQLAGSQLKGFEEHERMVFRLPRVPSHQIAQEKTSSSFRFDPTSAAQAFTRFPQ